MLKTTPSSLLVFSGAIWLIVGLSLLPLGLNFLIEALLNENRHGSYLILNTLSSYVGGLDSAVFILVALSLVIGFLKGHYVLSKSVHRSVNRLLSLPSPLKFIQIYPISYYFLLGLMGLMGALLRFTSLDVRGSVDIIVGSALIRGAFLYFQHAWILYRRPA